MADGSSSLSRSSQATDSSFSNESADSTVVRCPLKKDDDHWIELQVVDEDGFPVSNIPYWIKLPNEEVREGNLDEEGFVHIEGIPEGRCQVRIQDVDRDEWSCPPRQSPVPKAEGIAWIEIELKDEEGQPVAGHTYRLTMPSGEVREGALDENGFAIEKNLPPEACTLSFPDLDSGDFL